MKNYFINYRLILAGLVLVFFITRAMPAFAQTTVRNISLQDAIQLSLQNSHQLHASVARVDQADAKVEEAKNSLLPQVSVTGSYMRLSSAHINNMMADNQSGSHDSAAANVPSPHQAMYGMANLSLPLFTGGKIKYGIESAKYLQRAAELDNGNDTQAVVLNTIDAYTNLYKADAVVRVIAENLAQSKFRDSVLLRLENNGLLARNDRLKAQLQTSNIELSLLDAQNNRKTAMMNMDLMLGLPAATSLETDSAGFVLPEDIYTVTELEQLSVSNRDDLLALLQREKAAQTGIQLSKSDYLPTVVLTGGYIAGRIPGVISVSNAVNIGVGLKYNLSSLWETKSKIKEADARYRELTANEAQLRDAIELQISSTYENFLLQKKKISVFDSAVEQAEENARITENKFDNQLVNTTDLLDANVLLLQTRINLVVGKADLYLAYAKMLQTAGVLNK